MQMANLAGTKVGGRREGKGLTWAGFSLSSYLRLSSSQFAQGGSRRRDGWLPLEMFASQQGWLGRSYLAVTSVTSITFVFLVTVTRLRFKSNFPNPASQSRANLLSVVVLSCSTSIMVIALSEAADDEAVPDRGFVVPSRVPTPSRKAPR